LFPAKSYLSSIEFPLTFGLGNAQKVDELTITWPSGKVTTLTDLKADQIYQVNEESGVAR
ncbi:MAG: ASPIC/UnbV domain-containing protein, partial [Isosphaeraceae bacterium]